jgi:glycosyltransferase involved in cell wall biosynthesis
MSTVRDLGSNGDPSRFLPALRVKPSVGFVSTFPPTMCGLATFTASLRQAMVDRRGGGEGLVVVELVEGPAADLPRPEVIASIDPGDPLSMRLGVDRLNSVDAVILQHEYGIWGPEMGWPVIDFTDRLRAPVITTLHTVLASPTKVQEEIVEKLSRRSTYTVVPTKAARDRLCARYAVDPTSVVVIPHGTDSLLRLVARRRRAAPRRNDSPKLLTWGLIGPGKGLEWALQAVHLLRRRYPDLVYTIAGKTHPKVAMHQGESYRRQLERMVTDLGLVNNVRFIDDYMSSELLGDLLLETTLVVLPYDSTEQIVSGVLVEAVAANVPIVATEFLHSVELANQGAVATVPHRDPGAIAETIIGLLDSADARQSMVAADRAIAPDLEWASVAAEYETLVEYAVVGSAPMRHVSPAS